MCDDKAYVNEEELLPCPFCGQKPVVSYSWHCQSNMNSVGISCDNKLCFAQPCIGHFVDGRIAKMIWNRRGAGVTKDEFYEIKEESMW